MRKQTAHNLLLARALRSTEEQLVETIEVYTTVLRGKRAAAKPPTERKPRAPRKQKTAAAGASGTDSDVEPVN